MSDEWLYEQLSDLLQFPVPQDMIDYIKSITNTRDLEDYLRTLLDFNNQQHKRFLQELLEKRKGIGIGYKKNEFEDYIAPKVEKKKKEKGNKAQSTSSSSVSKKEVPDLQTQTKKKKFVNLYSQEGQNREVVLLKGRHKCDCQASKHQLVNNCVKCGRVVCQQEGSGPCLFCGNLVCSREEQEFLNSGTKQSSQMLQKLMDQKPPGPSTGYEAAIQHRNRLLEYDRTRSPSHPSPSLETQISKKCETEKRTRVIDDESDYFSTNSVWLSQTEREKLKKKEEEMQARKHQSRKDRTMTLDIGLRKMIEAKSQDDIDLFEIDEVLQEISRSVQSSDTNYYNDESVDPSSEIHPKFNEDVKYELERGRRGSNHNLGLSLTKVQDREYLEMVDEGLCLSMHQPWASMLVCGIKLHEGRNWYTSHRGRLWIASASKAPSDLEIRDMEELYRNLKGTVVFPLTYPAGCLLGCVTVVDCLSQEEYRTCYPDGESDSPFVFICEDPLELPIRFPMSGKHKIYKLDPLIHQAAQKAMQHIAKIKADKNSQSFLRNS